MTNHTIITIGRQFGSGGHEIGNRLSERLNIPLYDNNLISMAAHELSISQEAAEKVDETILGKFLSAYVVNMRDYTVFINDSNESVPLSDKVYEVQSSIINRLADRGPCIFVGRCADYIFRDHRNVLNIYIYAKYAPGDLDSKQIMIDSSMLGVKGTAEVLAEIVQRRFGLRGPYRKRMGKY